MATGETRLRHVMVFGAESDTGYRLVQLARREQWTVRAVVRRERDRELLESMGASVLVADPIERPEVEAVFAVPGAADHAVVCFIGGSPQRNSQGNIHVIDAAAAAGVSRFLLTTSVGCGDSSVVLDPFVKAFAGKAIRAKNWAETRLKETAMGWTILRSGGMTVRPGKAGPIAVESSQVVGYINRQDLGDVAWKVLKSPRSTGRIYAAVDRARAIHINGEPVVEADL